MVTDVFNRIVTFVQISHGFKSALKLVINRNCRSCHTKCISRYAEGDLNKGESVCIDRCVAKFFEVNKKVGEKLQGNAAANPGGTSFGI